MLGESCAIGLTDFAVKSFVRRYSFPKINIERCGFSHCQTLILKDVVLLTRQLNSCYKLARRETNHIICTHVMIRHSDPFLIRLNAQIQDSGDTETCLKIRVLKVVQNSKT